LSGLIAEIIVGCVMGPEVLNVVSEVAGIRMLGLLGLLLIVLEGGLHIELATLRKIGMRAFLIAMSGTTLPVLVSLAIMPRFAAFSNIEGVVAGVSLSSTAIGMAAKLMQSLGLLKTHIGKLITCAAMIDDVASLVLLAIISNTVSDCDSIDAVVWAVALPLISSIVFIVCGTLISFFMPVVVARLHRYVHRNHDPDESPPDNTGDIDHSTPLRQKTVKIGS
jgi:Kef-type K+ transport system membrane component KefB